MISCVITQVSFKLYQEQCLPSFCSVLSLHSSTIVLHRSAHMTHSHATQHTDLPRLDNDILPVWISILFHRRLPVPTLAETAQKYLKTVAPLLNNEEFNDTKKVGEHLRKDARISATAFRSSSNFNVRVNRYRSCC
jgi:hypothetical protein